MPALENARPLWPRKRRFRLRTRAGVERPAGYRNVAGAYAHNLADWSVFATLTFAVGVSDYRADALFTRWLRSVAEYVTREHVTVAYASGYQSGGFLHFHALLAFPAPVECDRELFNRLDRLWQGTESAAGFTSFRSFDRDKGAAWYLTEHAEVGFGIACPRRPRCRRKAGCRVTSCPM